MIFVTDFNASKKFEAVLTINTVQTAKSISCQLLSQDEVLIQREVLYRSSDHKLCAYLLKLVLIRLFAILRYNNKQMCMMHPQCFF